MSESADPIVNALNHPFWDGAAEGRLMMPHCVVTGAAFWPPSPISPFAQGRDVEWRMVAAEGEVLASVVYRRAFQRAFADRLPYGIAMVALDCGPRLQAHVEAPDDAGSPRTSMRVALYFQARPDGRQPLLVAHPITD